MRVAANRFTSEQLFVRVKELETGDITRISTFLICRKATIHRSPFCDTIRAAG